MTLDLDPALLSWLDQDDRRTADIIRRHGVHITYVGGDECACCAALNRAECRRANRRANRRTTPAFAYTVGLFGIGHPELAVIGMPQEAAVSLLNRLAARIRAGGDLTPGEVIEPEECGHRVLVEVLPNPGEIAFAANRFYQRPAAVSVDVLQLIWADADGRFPGEAGCSIAARSQPLPGKWRA